MKSYFLAAFTFAIVLGAIMLAHQTSFSEKSAVYESSRLSEIVGESYSVSSCFALTTKQDCKTPVQTCGGPQAPIGTRMCRPSDSGAKHECSCGCYAAGWVCSECSKGCNPGDGKCYKKGQALNIK